VLLLEWGLLERLLVRGGFIATNQLQIIPNVAPIFSGRMRLWKH